MMARTHGRVGTYQEWCRPKIVSNASAILRKELDKLKKKPDYVHLCLTTDPFMNGFPEVTGLSLDLIEIINSHGIDCSILTKGLLPSVLSDRSRFSSGNIYGISLISLDEEFRQKWEPGTAAYAERISALKVLHENGCNTLVHMEPYPTPNIVVQNLEDILKEVRFTDNIYFSRWNYNNKVKQFLLDEEFYSSQFSIVRRFCRENRIESG